MIGQVHSNIRAIEDTRIQDELAVTEGFDIDETPRPAPAPGARDRSNRHDTPPGISPSPQFNEWRRHDKENQVRRPENG